MKRKTKSISFDLTDGYEIKLLEFAEDSDRGSFSKYIKRLIAFDMEGRQTRAVSPVVVPEIAENEEDASIDGFL